MKKECKNILAIETSSNYLGLGLFDSDNKLSTIHHYLPNSHDTLLAESIKYLLIVNNLNVNDLDFVTISSGPGSFTGLRIGASLAKALCFEEGFEIAKDLDELNYNKSNNPKLISVSSLELLLIDFINKNIENVISKNIVTLNEIDKNDNLNLVVNIYLKSHKNIYYKQAVDLVLSKEFISNYKNINIENIYSKIDSKFNEIELIEINEHYISEIDTDFINNNFKINFNVTNSNELFENLKNQKNSYFVALKVENLIQPTLKKIMKGEFEDPSTFVPLYSQEFKLINIK